MEQYENSSCPGLKAGVIEKTLFFGALAPSNILPIKILFLWLLPPDFLFLN